MKRAIFFLYRLLFAYPFFYRLNYYLYCLALRGMGILNYENSTVSGERRFLKRVGSYFNNPVIVDVGCNEGAYATLCKEKCPGASVYGIEPHPQTYARLLPLAERFGFMVFQYAVNDKEAELTLYDYADKDGSSHASLYSDVIPELHGSTPKSTVVPAVSLDYFLQTNGIERVNLLKIDTEGHELKVLQGAKKYLEAGKIDIIHFEFNQMNTISRTFMRDFYEILKDFDFYRLLPRHLLPLGPYSPAMSEIFLFHNNIAINKRISHSFPK